MRDYKNLNPHRAFNIKNPPLLYFTHILIFSKMLYFIILNIKKYTQLENQYDYI